MSEASTPEGTGLTEAQAAAKLEAMLSGDGDSDGDETEEETPQSEDEEEPEQGESEDEDGSEDDEEDAPSEQELNDDAPVTFKVGEEDVTVTLHELKRGFLREQDYTRKTQALSEKAKAYDATLSDFAPLAERTKALLEHLEAAYRAPLYDENELAQLRFSDPSEWAARQLEIDQRQRQVDYILGHKAELETVSEAEKQRQSELANEQFITDQAKAIDEVVKERPEWRANPAEGQKAIDRINTLGRQISLDDDEWKMVRTDHRLMLVLADAAEMRELRAKKPKIRETLDRVKAAKPGTATQSPSKVTEITRAKQRLAKTGDVKDAAAAIERLM